MRKKSYITKKEFDAIDDFLKKQDIQLPTVVVVRLFKINILTKKFLNFILESSQNQKNDDNEYEDMDYVPKKLDKDTEIEFSYLKFLESLSLAKDTEITRFFLNNLRSRDRNMVIETYYMSPIEKYVYYIIKNKMQKNERIILSQILSLVRNFKGYKIENEKYFYDMAKKIKDKVRKKINAKNQAETE
jgi:hypothetical protein